MEDSDFSPKAHKIMGILAIVFGLFVALVGPFLIQNTLLQLMEKVASLIPTSPEFTLTGVLLPTFFFVMRGVGVVAGISLVLISPAIFKGEKWAWPVAVFCIALPTIFGIFTALPFLVQFSRPAPAALILIFGLITYLTFILMKKGDKITKLGRTLVFTLLGVVPAHIIVLVNHGIKGLIDRPNKPLLNDPTISIYGFEAPLNFIAFILCIIAILKLAQEKESGWYLGLIAGVTVIIANFPTHFIRMQTSDFFVAGMLGLFLTAALICPRFKRDLLGVKR